MRDKAIGTARDDTRIFWDANPCDGQADIKKRMDFRYGKEPWLPDVLRKVAKHRSVLEVGCGQGTDAIYCSKLMGSESTYTGIDYSPNSVKQAMENVRAVQSSLPIVPELEVGDGENLRFADNSFECVSSIGVLHHTQNTVRAINEVARVLKPGGNAYIALYRLYSPKLIFAYMLRFLAKIFDIVTFKQGRTLELVRAINPESIFGTMFIECIGVPIIKSYTLSEIEELFKHFSEISVRPVGIGFKLFGMSATLDNFTNSVLGAMWLIEAKK